MYRHCLTTTCCLSTFCWILLLLDWLAITLCLLQHGGVCHSIYIERLLYSSADRNRDCIMIQRYELAVAMSNSCTVLIMRPDRYYRRNAGVLRQEADMYFRLFIVQRNALQVTVLGCLILCMFLTVSVLPSRVRGDRVEV